MSCPRMLGKKSCNNRSCPDLMRCGARVVLYASRKYERHEWADSFLSPRSHDKASPIPEQHRLAVITALNAQFRLERQNTQSTGNELPPIHELHRSVND